MSRVFKNFIDSIRTNRLKQQQILRGKDYLGNLYYEKKLVEDSSGHSKRPTRFVEPPNPDMNESPNIPPEWDSWLRMKRPEPPSEGEVERNMAVADLKQRRAAEKQMLYSSTTDDASTGSIGSTAKTPEQESAFPSYSEYDSTPGKEKKTR